MAELLTLEDVRKSYWRGPRELVVLAGVSLVVQPGELVAVWGQRGAGKTTLAMVAAGLLAPDAGAVRFDGQDLVRLAGGRARVLRQGVSWMQRVGPQSDDFRMALDYVALPLLGNYSPRMARRRAAAMFTRLGIDGCTRERWGRLTDGERTLVALAHALVREPRLLVADDPTVNLNVLQREEVLGLLRQAADEEDVGILIAVPDMPDMAHADRLGSLSEGRLTLSGQPQVNHHNVIAFPSSQSA